MPRSPRRLKPRPLPDMLDLGPDYQFGPGAPLEPPNGLPSYRLLTGKDDAEFCLRVSQALKLGYRLHGSPSITFNGSDVIAAQALLWPYLEGDNDCPF